MSTTDTTNLPDGAERRRSRSGDDDLRYGHVIREFASRPWALHVPTLAIIQDLLRYRALGHRLSRDEVDERIAAGQERAAAVRSGGMARGGVAVIPLYGIVAQRSAAFDSVSSPSGTSVEQFTQMLRTALADDGVDSILIEIDSPGGSVDGVPELAAELRSARGKKPLVAIANTLAASAAYWIGAQCDELVVTPSGEVGSIGVYCAHEDLSAALEQEGVKLTLISAGKYKTEGNPFEALSAEALAAIQGQVDDFYSMFVGDVAKGRGVPVSQVRDGFGEGRTVLARDAVAQGMADRVATFDETLARLLRGGAQPRRRGADISVERLSLEPGDRIVLRINDPHPSPAVLEATKAALEEKFPGHEAIVLANGVELGVIAAAAHEAPAEGAKELADPVGEKDSPATAELNPAATRLLARPGFRRAYTTKGEGS